MVAVFFTNASTSPWTRPADWTDAGHTVNLVGAGGRGGVGSTGTSARSGTGGGGGGHVLLTYSSGALASTTAFSVSVDNTSGTQTTNSTRWLSATFANTYYVQCGDVGDAGGVGSAGGLGGVATTTSTGSPVGPVYSVTQNNNGGAGGATAAVIASGSGGGGAAGPSGVGRAGGACGTASRGGGGGGGANNGSIGVGTPGSATGGNGGNGLGGSGGGTGSSSGAGGAGTANTGSGGGGGFFSATVVDSTGGAGANDDLWTQTSDSATGGSGGGGGGGGGCSLNSPGHTSSGGNGGNYGSGGGGAGGTRSTTSTRTGGTGASGLIVITYTATLLSTSDAWNVNDKSASITLSNVDKTATGTAGGSNVGVRSTQARANGSAGKYYGEFLLHIANVVVGIAPTSALISSGTPNFVVQGNTGNITVNSAGAGNIGAGAIGDTISVAWDAGAELVWFRLNAGNWNGSGTANPATGVGGINCSFAASTDHCLYFRGFNLNDSVTVRTELAEFAYAGPSGFTSWMGEAFAEPEVPRRAPVIVSYAVNRAALY